MQLSDLIGKKFGRLMVVSYMGIINDSGSHYWECKCDCGKITQAHTSYLNNGRKASCGCIRREKSRRSIQKLIGWNLKPEGEAAFNAFYQNYKGGCKKKNMAFEISKEQFYHVTQKNCFYCEALPLTPHARWKNAKSRLNGPYYSNGIDRLDSSRGYVEGNMVPCCRICNLMKHELSIENFYNHIEKLYNHINKNRENHKNVSLY